MSNPIARLNAALDGRYRVESELGEGGMAKVYLADDIKHERRVALKVLKPELAAVVGAERFLAEIKTTANLQHPHILPLFDSGEADSYVFYVMPYVEGETLRERLDREHQLSVDEAVRIVTDLAEALDYAHRHDIVHRDIKPANILMHEERPLIADFGIALAIGTAGGGRLTETGLSLGTPYYMSPEQATGEQFVGPATDTYALGAVLYEMLTGDPPYMGSTAQAVLGQIIAGDAVTATKKRASVPAHVDAALRCALEKLPADRFARTRDFAAALADSGFTHGLVATGAEAAAGPWKRRTYALAALLGVATLALGWSVLRPQAPLPAGVERFTLDIELPAVVRMPDLLPDGSGVVYTGTDPNSGDPILFVRRWAELLPVAIPGTEGVLEHAVSPTGEEIALAARGGDDIVDLRVVSTQGGGGRTLIENIRTHFSWGGDGYLYGADGEGLGILRVRADGSGEIERLTEVAGAETLHLDFQLLPDADVGVFTVYEEGAHIEAVRLSTGERRTLAPGARPFVTETGHIVFGSWGGAGELLAARFDARTMALEGPAVPILQDVARSGGRVIYGLSAEGTLVYATQATPGINANHEFVWVTRAGAVTRVDPGSTFRRASTDPSFRLSPDGSRVAFAGHVDGNDDIFIKALPDGAMSRVTFDPARENAPTWSPDGQRLVFRSDRGNPRNTLHVWTKRADGSGPTELLFDGFSTALGMWSPDGEWLIVRRGATGRLNAPERDVFGLRPGVDSVAIPLVADDAFGEQAPAISWDSRWIAYSSNETGRYEIFVRPFPNTGDGRWLVSQQGGIQPVWAHNGRELFFVDPRTDELLAAEFTTTATAFQHIRTTSLFEIPRDILTTQGQASFYDVAPRDDRFLMVQIQNTEDVQYVLVKNFFELLRERVPN